MAPGPFCLSLREEQRKWVWRLEGPQRGSQLVPLQDQASPPVLCPAPTSPPHPSLLPPKQGLVPNSRAGISGQGSELLCSVRVSASLVSPPRRNDPAAGAVSNTLMPVCLSSLCPGAPGAGCGVALGGDPASARPMHGSPSRRGTPTTSAAQAGRVAGTLEKGGEVPSLAWAPARPHRTGNLEVSFSHRLWLLSGPWLSLSFPFPSG